MQDLNLKPRNSEKERNVLIKRVFECGWDRIAWNTVATGKITSSSQSKLIKSAQLSQIECCESKTWRSLVTSNQTTQVKQYNRLTMIIDELVDAQQLTAGNEYLRSFDIIAVCPGNAKIFSFLCKTAQIDIISINFAHKIPFTLNKKLVGI
jgi:RNase P/RNase MRP subunit p30